MDFVNAIVEHKAWGKGTVISVEGGYIKATFPKVGEKSLLFPGAFEQKFLKFPEEALQQEVEAFIADQKAESERKAEEVKVKAEKAAEEKKKKLAASFGVTGAVATNGARVYTKRRLIEAMGAGASFTFHPFYGHTVTDPVTDYCFSNWYPCSFTVDGVTYHTTEQYMMSQKALLFEDKAIYDEIMKAEDPKTYKALGRQVRHFDSAEWNRHNYGIVLKGCKAKFSQNPELAKVLLETGNEVIVEASPRDTIWGVGLGKSNEKIQDPTQWRGTNYLGFILMEVRDYLRENP